MDLIQVRFIFGFIGTVISTGSITRHVPSFVAMYKNKSADRALPPHMLVQLFLHNMLWFFYGIVNKDSSCLVSTTCAVYLVLTAIYLSVFFISCGHMIDLCLFTLSSLMAGIIGVIVIVLITVLIESSSAKLTFVGVIGDISFISLTLDIPILSLKLAVVTKSVAHITTSIDIAAVIYGLVWGAYSCIYIFDPYIFMCSALQILVATVRLIVYAHYYKSTPRVKSD